VPHRFFTFLLWMRFSRSTTLDIVQGSTSGAHGGFGYTYASLGGIPDRTRRRMGLQEIARRWGIAEQTVNSYRRRLHTQLSWKDARASEQHERRRQNLARTFSVRLRQRWEAWRARREQRLRQLKLEFERSASPPPSRVCQMCGERWFATKDFFYITRKSAVNGSRTSMSHTCRLCQSVRRR